MRSLKRCIVLLFLTLISFHASANTNVDDLVKHAVAQLNKLYKENIHNDTHGKHNDNWYIYILGGTIEDLEYVKNETNKAYTSGYLKQLNELLKSVNQGGKVDVYVAFTDYTSELITPIFPPEYNTLTAQEYYIGELLGGNAAKEETVQLFRDYKTLLNNTIKRIYDQSLLSKSGKPNVFMPFTSFEERTMIDSKTATIAHHKKLYKTYTLYSPKRQDFKKGEYKERYKNISAQYGKTDTEQNIERVVRAINDYYYGGEIEYKECQELLAKEEFKKYLEQDEIWRKVIESNPCILYHIKELHGDYIGDTEFAKELQRVVNTMLYGAFAIPAAAIIGEYALFEVGKYLIEKYGANRVSEVSQAAITNIVIQTVINYYFDKNSYDDDNFMRLQKSLQNIDKINLSKDVFVSAYNINMRGDLILTCVTGGLEFNEDEWYDISEYDFDLLACKNEVIQQVLLGAVLKTGGAMFSKIYRLAKDSPKLFIKGFREVLNDTGADGAKAFREYLGEIKGAFDIDDKSLIGVKLDVEASYGDEVALMPDEINFKNLVKDVISDIEYNIGKNSSDAVKIGANIELSFNLPTGSQNIRPSILTELSDGTYRMVFVVNKNAPISSIEDFFPDATLGRKNVLENFVPNMQATLKGGNAQKYLGKTDMPITIKEVEFYTTDGNGGVVRNKVETVKVADNLENIFAGARKRAIDKFGEEAEELIYVKFNKEGGAAAEILDHYGADGLNALRKTFSIDEAAKEIVKNKIVYRAVNETTYNFEKLKTEGIIDPSPKEFPTYVSLDNQKNADIIKSKLQLPKKPTWVAEFNGNQILEDVRIPNGKYLGAEYKEVLCRSYPNLGEGGGSQFITNSQIKVMRLINLESGEIIEFIH